MNFRAWTANAPGFATLAVTEEVSEVPGVEAVDVVLETGTLSVTSSDAVDDAAVKAAVEEAGYQLA